MMLDHSQYRHYPFKQKTSGELVFWIFKIHGNSKNVEIKKVILYYQQHQITQMNIMSKRTHDDQAKLLDWQTQEGTILPLTALRPLSIDDDWKLVKLKALIEEYNEELKKGKVGRPHLKRSFVEKVYRMLLQMNRMYDQNDQRRFLHNIYTWATKNVEESSVDQNTSSRVNRFPTASTQSRSYSSQAKKQSPTSNIIDFHSKKVLENMPCRRLSFRVNDDTPWNSIREDKEYQKGHRTIHKEEDNPQEKLKQFNIKTYNIKQDFAVEKVEKSKSLLDKVQSKFQEIIEEQKPEQLDAEGSDICRERIEEGEEMEGSEAQEQENLEFTLRPKINSYSRSVKPFQGEQLLKLKAGQYKCQISKHSNLLQKIEENHINKFMKQWGIKKHRYKMEMKRRSESTAYNAKISDAIKKKEEIVPYQPKNSKVIDLSSIIPTERSSSRKATFRIHSQRKKNSNIKDNFVLGKISTHLPQIQIQKNSKICEKMTVCIPKSQKNFQQILSQAQKSIRQEAQQQIIETKSKCIEKRVAITSHKLTKGLSFDLNSAQDHSFRGINGQTLLHNPHARFPSKKKKKSSRK